MIVKLDFETRSRAPLRTCGVSRYARDPSTEVLFMAWKTPNAPVRLWQRGDPFPWQIIDNATEVHAHNAPFEKYIFEHVLKHPIAASKWRCSAVGASYASIPRSLEGAGAAVGLGELGKDKAGAALIEKLSKPQKDGTFCEDPELLRQFGEYCMQDVRAEDALDEALPTVPASEWKNWQVDRIINERGVPIDRELCEGAIAIIEEASSKSMTIADALSGGAIKTGGQIAKIKEFVNERGVNIHDLQSETVEWAIENTTNEEALAMLHLRQSVASAAAKKYPGVMARMDDDDRLREAYLFYGAHTGRRSSPGVQIHNLKKGFSLSWPDNKDDPDGLRHEIPLIEAIKAGCADLIEAMYSNAPISVLGTAVRAFVCASPGRTLLFADFSQIECRVAHWLAGNQKMLNLFAKGGDPYINFAEAFFHTTKVTKDQRQYAKPIVLGGNYGMGAARLIVYAEEYNVKLTQAQAEKTIKFFRLQNAPIVNYWRAVERAPVQCVLSGKAVRLGPLVFRMEGDWMTIELPSTRKLYYYRPELHEDKYGPYFTYQNTRGVREKLWGGTWLENLCQGITRDLTVLAQERCEDSYLEGVIDQHDELGVECDKGKATDSLAKLLQIMRDAPGWAKGLPVDADGRIRKRFEK